MENSNLNNSDEAKNNEDTDFQEIVVFTSEGRWEQCVFSVSDTRRRGDLSEFSKLNTRGGIIIVPIEKS